MKTSHEVTLELTFSREPAERGLRDRFGAPETPDRPAECRVESAEVCDDAVRAATPFTSGRTPITDGYYWFTEYGGETSLRVVQIRDQRHTDGGRLVTLIQRHWPNAVWAPILPPGSPVPVEVDIRKVPRATLDAWAVEGMREER